MKYALSSGLALTINKSTAAGIKTAARMGDHAAISNFPCTNRLVNASIPIVRTDTVSKETPVIKSGLFFAFFAITTIVIAARLTSTSTGKPRVKNQSLPPVSLSSANRKTAVPEHQMIAIR